MGSLAEVLVAVGDGAPCEAGRGWIGVSGGASSMVVSEEAVLVEAEREREGVEVREAMVRALLVRCRTAKGVRWDGSDRGRGGGVDKAAASGPGPGSSSLFGYSPYTARVSEGEERALGGCAARLILSHHDGATPPWH